MIFFITLIRFFKGILKSFKDPEFKGLLYSVIIILLSGTIFYNQIEKWNLLDSLFFSVTTLTTVGYGNLYPHTAIGKIFTIIYIFIGLGILLGFINAISKNIFRTSDKVKHVRSKIKKLLPN
ncbi:MAG: potassium channel family protein [Candidatus Shapirobacteria bacterium]|nr:potassium channel family protein [Candidatus Shapirobacteria bacterium]MDD4382534.1 potassium channel family protein [Candidatus Shapirobacteria bacterium]